MEAYNAREVIQMAEGEESLVDEEGEACEGCGKPKEECDCDEESGCGCS